MITSNNQILVTKTMVYGGFCPCFFVLLAGARAFAAAAAAAE